MKIVITGTGRCGTGYAAAVLSRNGLRCGHEDVFKPLVEEIRWAKYDADSSWIALAYPEHLKRHHVVHCVRNPLHVADSYLRMGFFQPLKKRQRVYFRQAVEICPEMGDYKDPVDIFSVFYAACIRRADSHCVFSYKTEEMDTAVVKKIFNLADRRIESPSVCGIRKNINTRPSSKKPQSVSWSRLFDTPEGPLIKTIAMRYGYLEKKETP